METQIYFGVKKLKVKVTRHKSLCLSSEGNAILTLAAYVVRSFVIASRSLVYPVDLRWETSYWSKARFQGKEG